MPLRVPSRLWRRPVNAALTSASFTAVLLLMTGCSSESSPVPAGANTPSALSLNAAVRSATLSPTESNRLLTVVSSGTQYYAAGFVTVSGDSHMAIARFGPTGELDTTFGTNGLATFNIAIGGKTAELARGIVVQSNGKIVVAGPIEHDPAATGDAARDTDIAVLRVNTTGQLDPTFGSNGVVRLDLGTGVLDGATFRGDTSWGLTLLPNDELLVVGGKLADGVGRTDLDYAVVKLTAEGTPDTGFGTSGLITLDLSHSADNPRTAVVQPDGNIVVSGHSGGPGGVLSTVLFRLTPTGQFDPTFGTAGVVNHALGLEIAEAYDVALQNTSLVIAGYGRPAGATTVDVISARFLADGTWDTAFGSGGLTQIDVAGEHDRSRKLQVLPDGHLLIVGQGKPTASTQDGAIVLLTPDGRRDTRLNGTGVALIDLGGPTDALFGLTLSPDKKSGLAVGWKGADPALASGPANHDDARAVHFSVPAR